MYNPERKSQNAKSSRHVGVDSEADIYQMREKAEFRQAGRGPNFLIFSLAVSKQVPERVDVPL